MSYDIIIKDPETGETLQTEEPHGLVGGTYCIGGTRDLTLNITFNYSKFYYREDTLGVSTIVREKEPRDGYLHIIEPERGGLPGLEYCTIPEARERVANAIAHLHGPRSADYWEPTEGNARAALVNLLCLLELAPENAKIIVDR